MVTVREVFETNTFGVMSMTQAELPGMRARCSGVIVNVTSSATLAPFPLVAACTASKTAIQGFTASLAHEAAEFGIRVKLIEPGYGPGTQFTADSGARAAVVWRAATDASKQLHFPAGADAVALADRRCAIAA